MIYIQFAPTGALNIGPIAHENRYSLSNGIAVLAMAASRPESLSQVPIELATSPLADHCRYAA